MSYEQEELERWKRDEEIRKNVEASFLNASRKDEWKKLDEFEAWKRNNYPPSNFKNSNKMNIIKFVNKIAYTSFIALFLILCYWTFTPLLLDNSNDTDSIKGWVELKSETAHFSDVKVVERVWLMGERGFLTTTYDVQVFNGRNMFYFERVSQSYMERLVDIYWVSGGQTTRPITAPVTNVNQNQGVINEYNAYSSQYSSRLNSFNSAVDAWNNKMDARNEFVSRYNSMSYSKQQSSATQDEKSLRVNELRTAGRNVIVECKVFESHIDDMLTFMEINRNVLMEMDSQRYMQRKSDLVASKTVCQNTEIGVNENLNRIG